MTTISPLRCARSIILVALALTLFRASSGASEVASPADDIRHLTAQFCEAVVARRSLDEFFSPAVRERHRGPIIELSSKHMHEFTISADNDVRLDDADHAVLRASIAWNSGDQSVTKTGVNIPFVRVAGRW